MKYRIHFEEGSKKAPTRDHFSIASALKEIERLRREVPDCALKTAHVYEIEEEYAMDLSGGYPQLVFNYNSIIHFLVCEPGHGPRQP